MLKSKVFNTAILFFYCSFAMAQMQDSSARKQRVNSKKMIPNDTFHLPEFKLKQKPTEFGTRRMKSVENTGIYEGKKTEVVIPDQLVANLATNNARQIFSRVAGLNIWENDGAGLQLNIGGRGLDPNRSSNFNVRQNGYDISADALGYPESYYTPPMEAVGKVQIVRGAASLQYGTQFGGLVNFILKQPVQNKKMEIILRQSVGSFGFYNAFNSISGTVKKLSYYTFFQYKRMDGWRENSKLNSYTFYTNLNYQLTKRTSLGFDYTNMNYLAQQPGGLTDAMFRENPKQTNRERNWFDVDWNLMALHFNHAIDSGSEINVRVFGLIAHRYSLGFRPNRVATIDNNSERDLIKGEFKNYGIEARYLKHYLIKKKEMVFLVGSRYYNGFNHSIQGLGSKGKDANFNFINTNTGINNDYTFPNDNISLFTENIFNISNKFSITPGLRLEYIHTRAKGHYNSIQFDLAGNIINTTRTNENRNDERRFAIAGLGLSYKPSKYFELYSNVSQNYRSITFSDMRITNPSQVIDPNLKDERGYSLDLGVRSNNTQLYTFDLSGFLLNYNNRIGEVQFYDASNRVLRLRTNIGRAMMTGIESYLESDIARVLQPKQKKLSSIVFINMAFIHARYLSGTQLGIKGNAVEFVPMINLKSGLRVGYKNFKASFQFTYLSEQFTDATNAVDGGVSAVVGIIPNYSIMDAGISYQYHRLKVEMTLNNLSNNLYFSRRATGYPGPGILPGDGRALFFTLGYKLN
jgi:Fe(3+) dicitrate transport protein